MNRFSLHSEELRDAVRETLDRDGIGQRAFEAQYGLPKWSLRGFLDERSQVPSLDRAAEIADAIGMQLVLKRNPHRDTLTPLPLTTLAQHAEGHLAKDRLILAERLVQSALDDPAAPLLLRVLGPLHHLLLRQMRRAAYGREDIE